MKMKKPLSAEAALTRAAALCARSEQAESDVRAKLLAWGLTPASAAQVIERLQDEHFLDEQRYARAYCRDKFNFNGWGRIKIAFSDLLFEQRKPVVGNSLFDKTDIKILHFHAS